MKALSVLLILLLALSLLAGCGAAPAEQGADAETCTYTVVAAGENGEAIPGVVVNFCTDTSCSPVTTNDDGTAAFTGAPDRYHVQVIRMPDGWQLDGEAEWYTETRAQTFRLLFTEAGK